MSETTTTHPIRPILLYSTEDVVAMTGLSQSTIRRAVEAGDLISAKFGKSLRFTRGAIETWIAESARIPGTEGSSNNTTKKKGKK